MDQVELHRSVADRLILLHVWLGRLADARLAEAIRDDAAPHIESLRSWSTARPSVGEASAVLAAVDELVARLVRARRSERGSTARRRGPRARARSANRRAT
jgi:hypothetical protein